MRLIVGLPLFLFLGIGLGVAEQVSGEGLKPNRLIHEKSPYLQQHAYNPVDWYAWGNEAFEKAKKEKKLILLSVGYSTCHWCHVMERESFQNQEIADFLNQHYVSVKLDREERPDVDQVYMSAFQAMTGQNGGWPLNMILTPDLKPLTGGTYFPPVERNGLPGFGSILRKVHGVWNESPEEIAKQVSDGHSQLQTFFDQAVESKENGKLNLKLVDQATKELIDKMDPTWGGLGEGEKFPQVGIFRFLLHSRDPKVIEAVIKTCYHMANGGIHDHVSGGFHRYTVDRQWVVPHFEKMLYDQAQLLELYLDAWQITNDEFFREVATGIADYVLREMVHPEGGFYCAQDAQSEGKEGKFACWTLSELEKHLDPEEVQFSQEVLGVTREGNFLDHSDPDALKNQNVLFYQKPRQTLTLSEVKLAKSIFTKLSIHRSKRVQAATDDKILASWNGLMIGALAKASLVLGQEKYLKAAKKAHAFVKAQLWDESDGKLYHRWREGERDSSLQAGSYLMYLSGTRKLYEATLEEAYLEFALRLAEASLEVFYDRESGGFFQGEQRDDLVLRLKGQFDGAIPTESSVAVREFAILAEITGRSDLREIAEKTLKSYLGLMESAPSGMGEMLSGLRFFLAKPPRLVIAGKDGRRAMNDVAAQSFDPQRIVMGNEGLVSEFTAGLKPIDAKATAYYCVGQSCQLPVNDPEKLKALLKKMSEGSR